MLLHYQSHTQIHRVVRTVCMYMYLHSGQSNHSLPVNSYVCMSIDQHSVDVFMHILVHAFMSKPFGF